MCFVRSLVFRGSVTVPVAAAIVNVEVERSAAAAQGQIV